MIKRVMFLLLACWLVVLVSASIDVYNYSVVDSYYSLEALSGRINMSIQDENYDELVTSNDNDSMMLGDFIEASGNIPYCYPSNCLSAYGSSGGSSSKEVGVSLSDKEYVGFVLTGSDVSLSSMSFGLMSDFAEGSQLPLAVEIFETEEWKFDKFSDDSFLEKDWGCYNDNAGGIGPNIGSTYYCEDIYISDSGKLFLGAKVDVSGSGNLTMTVMDAGVEGPSCDYDPRTSDGGCLVVPDDDIFSSGSYEICISAPVLTDYKIYNESVGENCGHVDGVGGESVKDFAIFAQGLKYADSDALPSYNFSDDTFVSIPSR